LKFESCRVSKNRLKINDSKRKTQKHKQSNSSINTELKGEQAYSYTFYENTMPSF